MTLCAGHKIGIVAKGAKIYCKYIGHGILVLMAAIVVVSVLTRVAKVPLLGSVEMITMLAAVYTSFAVVYCAVWRGHIAITILVDRLPQRMQAIINTITGAISVVVFAAVGAMCGVWGTQVWHSHRVLLILGVPLFPFIYIVGFGCLMLALVLIADTYKLLSKSGETQ